MTALTAIKAERFTAELDALGHDADPFCSGGGTVGTYPTAISAERLTAVVRIGADRSNPLETQE